MNAAALIDLEQRVADHADTVAAGQEPLERVKDWLLTESTDERGETLPNGLRRAVQIRRATGATRYPGPVELWVGQLEAAEDPGGAGADPEVQEENTDAKRLNTTAAGQALYFLARYALYDPGRRRELLPHIERFGRALLPYQYADSATLRRGGFPLASNYTPSSAFGTATIGKAMLYAYKASGNTSFFQSALSAADYLLRLADPNTYWFPAYGVNPINRTSGGTTWYGFCDRVDGADKIFTTSTTWNLVAASFLYEMGSYTGVTAYTTAATEARDFMATGALEGRDYFAVSSNVDATYVSVAWPNVPSHVYNDHAWHRLGDPTSSGSVGTDNPEYGLQALYQTGYSVSAIRSAYDTFRALPHSGALSVGGLPAAENSDGGTFGAAFNSAISWCGYFRLGTLGTNSRPDRQYGTYYDSQGAGTLAGLKAAEYPSDFEQSRTVLENVTYHAALLDQNLDTKWSAATGYDYATKGTIVVASAGTGLIDALEGVV